MTFKKMQASKYPPRLWALVGYPNSGKSTFATRMRGPILVVDADHRFTEVLHLSKDVYALSDVPEDNVNADRIAQLLTQNMPGSDIKTIVIDPLTSIITPLVIQAMVDKDAGRVKNLSVAFRGKALAMRQLQDAVTRWGTDVLWVYHKIDARDEKANEKTRDSIPATEIIRLTRSLNAQLEVVANDNGKRGIKIVWSRAGREGQTLWDESGSFKFMPEMIEAAMYDGLTDEWIKRKEVDTPEFFPTPEIAIGWAMEQGVFNDIQHARNQYDKIKREQGPQSAREMATLWIADVKSRKASQPQTATQDGDPNTSYWTWVKEMKINKLAASAALENACGDYNAARNALSGGAGK